MSVAVHGHQIGIGAVGDVLDDARRQTDERAVVVDRAVEVASGKQERAGEHEIAEAAIVEVERASGVRDLLREARSIAATTVRGPGGIDWKSVAVAAANAIPRTPGIEGIEERRGPRQSRTATDNGDRERSMSSAGQVWSAAARFDAFLRKSDGPRLSPRNRRTSPVDAPSS